jgi:hypothetical protein
LVESAKSRSERDLKRLEEWRATGTPVDVVVVSREGSKSEAVAYRADLTTGQRVGRAAIGLLVCWLLAVAFVFVPILHFIMPFVFLLAGPIVAWMRYKGTSVVLGGLATCPRCQAPMRIKKATETWPIEASCDECRAIVHVEPKPVDALAKAETSGA